MNLTEIKNESRKLPLIEEEKVSGVLERLADLLENNVEVILKENARDLEKIASDDPIFDRVKLTEERIFSMVKSVREIAGYNSPVGLILEERTLKNGLNLKKVSTPIGVVGVIFEARPNVVIDIFALCFKSRNACVLKGGSQSEFSNEILVKLIKEALGEFGKAVILLSNEREIVAELLKADKFVDVIVPRGGQGLINFVRENSKVPVIETGAGVVHTYFDEFGDLEKGREIIFNAKTSRVSVCNSMDTLIIHRSRLSELPELCKRLEEFKVEIFADEDSFAVLDGHYPLLAHANEENFGEEYLGYKMSIKTLDTINGAIDHINHYGSGHSEAIVTENEGNKNLFLKAIDAACVYVNASTRFTDGGEFGLGAEVGISTQKLHARGPMGIKELTSYKWEILGNGQVRL